jgi:hypothetical protein
MLRNDSKLIIAKALRLKQKKNRVLLRLDSLSEV